VNPACRLWKSWTPDWLGTVYSVTAKESDQEPRLNPDAEKREPADISGLRAGDVIPGKVNAEGRADHATQAFAKLNCSPCEFSSPT
jgi:hypothetical protein